MYFKWDTEGALGFVLKAFFCPLELRKIYSPINLRETTKTRKGRDKSCGNRDR
jgi:hypothetical protein